MHRTCIPPGFHQVGSERPEREAGARYTNDAGITIPGRGHEHFGCWVAYQGVAYHSNDPSADCEVKCCIQITDVSPPGIISGLLFPIRGVILTSIIRRTARVDCNMHLRRWLPYTTNHSEQGKSERYDSCKQPSNLAEIRSKSIKSSMNRSVWLWNLTDNLVKNNSISYMPFQALCIIS